MNTRVSSSPVCRGHDKYRVTSGSEAYRSKMRVASSGTGLRIRSLSVSNCSGAAADKRDVVRAPLIARFGNRVALALLTS